MRKVFAIFSTIVSVAILLGAVFAAGIWVGVKNYCKWKAVVVEEKPQNSFDLELPMETERRVVTVDEVEARLIEIGELSTYSGTYTQTYGKDDIRYMLDDIPVLFSTNSIELTCNGIVKVGYDLSDIIVNVDDDTIYISIPEAKLNDNYVIWDSVECNETNNILNPIKFSQYEELIAEIEKKGLEDVTQKGIYQRAEDNLKVLIRHFLGEFTDYTIVFM